jgi:acyl dehydratase
VFIGDTLMAESEVLDVRESKSRPNQGVVTIRTSGFKQDRTRVIEFERSMLIPRRGHAVDDLVDY